MTRLRFTFLAMAVIFFALAGCTGSEGPAGPSGADGAQGSPGPTGADGAQGLPGPAGTDGLSYIPPEFIGSEACAECHQETYDVFVNSGHPHQLTPVIDGRAPEFPFTEVDDPPAGYTWDDISYVIGGYNWKVRFIDQDGYIITGDAEATTQYNLENEDLNMGDEWVAYHAGEELPYDCGTCHTTGYSPIGNQDNRAGLIGTWAFGGIQCEACHGAGSLHANNPGTIDMKVERDAEACATCHTQRLSETVEISNGFISHHDQYDTLFPGKHAVIDCVVCHDPHQGVVQLRQEGPTAQTTQTICEDCHLDVATNVENELHGSFADCIDCHMPEITTNAVANPTAFAGDLRTHMVTIDSTLLSQTDEDGSFITASGLALESTCRGCHNTTSNSIGPEVSDEELLQAAAGYHNPPAPVVETAPEPGVEE